MRWAPIGPRPASSTRRAFVGPAWSWRRGRSPEAGDLLIPIQEGVVQAGHIVADLAEMVRGAEVRRSPEDITLFKSVGMGFEDLIVARAVVDAGQ